VSALLLLVVLAVAGAPLALRVCGPRAEVVALAPLLGAGYLAAAALVEVAVGGPPFALAGSALTVGALAPLTTVRKVRAGFAVAPRDGLLLTAPVLVLGWVLTTLERVQVSYDGRSIWLFHARMLAGGRQLFLAQAHLFAFSHPDYPPLVPAAVALGWRVAGATELVIGALTACATLLAGLAVARALGSTGRLAPAAAALCVGVLYGVWGQYASNGFVDPLCAALVLAAAVSGLLGAPGEAPLALTLVALAAVTKNEGLVFGLVVHGGPSLAGGARSRPPAPTRCRRTPSCSPWACPGRSSCGRTASAAT